MIDHLPSIWRNFSCTLTGVTHEDTGAGSYFVAARGAVAYTPPVPNRGVSVSRIELPLPIFFALIVLTLVLMGQGLRLASDHQEGFEPSRPPVLVAGYELEIDGAVPAILFLDPPPGSLAIYQELPERELLRWKDTGAAASEAVLIPLAGLEPGTYLVCRAPATGGAATQEMDRPARSLDVLRRFTILPR